MDSFLINMSAGALRREPYYSGKKHKLTCDADFGRPLGGPVQHGLLGQFQVAVKFFFRDVEHLLDHLEDLGTVLLSYLHALLHGHDDILGLVLGSVLGALLHGPWGKTGNRQSELDV